MDPPEEGKPFTGSGLPQDQLGRDPVFQWIPPGTFQMGSYSETDPDRDGDETPHTVVLTRGYWILDHEVTQNEISTIFRNHSAHRRGNIPLSVHLPAENVAWVEAVEFCEKLTTKNRSAGRITNKHRYRLPTEAEWEYAARGRTTESRYTVDGKNVIDSLDLIAWWEGNSKGGNYKHLTHLVALKKPNDFGLYDMIGNVWEWCYDWYALYPEGRAFDPSGPKEAPILPGIFSPAPEVVIRGGAFDSASKDLRSANREMANPNYREDNIGFRPVLVLEP